MKKIKNKKEALKYYMSLVYPIRIIEEEKVGYFAEIEELAGCMTQGDTIEEAWDNIQDAKEQWLMVALEKNIHVPLPSSFEKHVTSSVENCSIKAVFSSRIIRILWEEIDNLFTTEGEYAQETRYPQEIQRIHTNITA
ncbi:type II toxin-antitoxin system HicB family antitoxin [candidate division WOR-3 bacterium]|nr:type II toxin-antitoxin system HicB family antitoxin [candidate division WOR-3 bacterium]